MKLNYRDRIIIGVLLAVVILLIGFLTFIKSENQSIKDNKATLSTLESSKAEVESKLDEIPGIKDDITAAYNKGIEYTETFVDYNSFYNGRKFDQYMQSFAEECEVKIMSLSVGEMSEGSLAYYYFSPSFVADGMRSELDINGNYAATKAKESEESDALSERTAENVIQATYTITVTAEEQENIWKYLETLEKQEETMLINSVALQNIVLKEDKDAEPLTEEEKEKTLPGATFTITLYSVVRMDEPNLEMEN